MKPKHLTLSDLELAKKAYRYHQQKPLRTKEDFQRIAQLEKEFPQLKYTK